MKKLLEDPEGFYTPKKRPSGHDIGKSFGKNNGGAIPSNLLQISNSESNGSYLRGCKTVGAKGHPARFPSKLPEFFIRFLTEPGDLVLDIFAGSNTTGYVAQCEGRKWMAFDERLDYLATSSFRFFSETVTDAELKTTYDSILASKTVDLCVNVLNAPSQQPRNGNFRRPAVATQDLLILAERAGNIAPTQVAKIKTVSYRRQTKRRPKVA